MYFTNYAYELIKDIPSDVFEGLTSIICIGMVTFIAWKGWKTGIRLTSVLLLVEYVFLIFSSTVIFRSVSATRQYDFHPFWSYDRPDLLIENIMNVIVFIPVGMILGSLLRVKGSWSKYGSWFKVNGSSTSEATKSMTWLIVLLIGCSISVTIEALQFCFMKGFSEVDDVMHNTLGCIVGFMIVSGFRHITAAVNHLHRTPRCFSVLC